MIAPNIRNGVHIVAETDHYQLLDLDNDDSRLGFRQFKLVSKQPMHKANWWLGWMVKGWHEITMLVCSMKIIQKSLSGLYRR